MSRFLDPSDPRPGSVYTIADAQACRTVARDLKAKRCWHPPGYYECHVTFTTPTGLDPGIRGWKFSRIDGDPVLGRGVKSYLTRQFKDSRPLREVIDEVEFTAAMLRDSGPEFNVLRTKVEHVCYDSKQLPESLLQ